MKKIYRTTKIRPRGVEVAVRQVLGSGKSNVSTAIHDAEINAQIWLAHALTADPRTNSRDASIFRHCFCGRTGSADISTVRAVFSTIKSALAKPHGVKVNKDDGSTFGYVKRSYKGRPHLVGGTYQYDVDGDLISKRGEVHVCLLAVDTGSEMATITLIHEAGHKFANLRDHGWRGYFDDDCKTFEQPGLTGVEALYNADSYAVFCYKIAKARGLLRTKDVDDDGEFEGMFDLFG